MRYFLDTEFIESGPHKPIDLISIGIIAEDGREFYRQSCEFDPDVASEWICANVFPHLTSCRCHQQHTHARHHVLADGLSCGDWLCPWYSLDEIKRGIKAFIGNDQPEFWGWYADYDWVVFCQTMGRLVDLPESWPKHCKDLKQWQVDLGRPDLKAAVPQETAHHALADARWNRRVWDFLSEMAAK